MYPVIDELELEIRAGRGIAIIVEGDSYGDDPLYYGQWFNNQASQVTFFPQNGWPKVIAAVLELRQRCPGVPVYGVIDRDFTNYALDAAFVTQGILRTPLYTLENYLLDPNCWAQVFTLIFRPHPGGVPDGWGDPVRVQAYIEQAYRDCLVLAAHNWVIKFGHEHYFNQATQTRQSDREYRENLEAFGNVDPADKLGRWGQQLAANEDFTQLYTQKLQMLNQANLDEWEKQVSGKYVLHQLHQQFPRRPGRRALFDLGHYLNLYLDKCIHPPADLVRLIDHIIQDAGR